LCPIKAASDDTRFHFLKLADFGETYLRSRNFIQARVNLEEAAAGKKNKRLRNEKLVLCLLGGEEKNLLHLFFSLFFYSILGFQYQRHTRARKTTLCRAFA
jgi:hypothetical protein